MRRGNRFTLVLDTPHFQSIRSLERKFGKSGEQSAGYGIFLRSGIAMKLSKS